VEFSDRVRLIHANFGDLRAVLDGCGVAQADGILADLGLSSNQLLNPERGFSFDADGPLDMRMDQSQRTTAADILNAMSEGELSDLLYLQSQERHSRRIAKRICQARRQGRLNSTAMLARLVASATGEGPTSHRGRIHPATRTFMALRMSVNSEIDTLRRLLAQVPACLAPGGRVAVISFHSVEDRVVKLDFREHCRGGDYGLVTKKPVIADEPERLRNPRSRSAKMRVAQRTIAQ
jgi:16S rRNA (cytosine1402-N4)-methyltransferase